MTARPLCKGMTTPRPAYNGKPEVPSRPCGHIAPAGREYCLQHDPDKEYVAARRAQNKLAEGERQARWVEERHQRHLAHQVHLDRLFQVTLIPDTSNGHRCHTVGVLDPGSDQCDSYHGCPAELVQCGSYLGHETVSDHLSEKACGGYYQVYWRD